MERIYGIRTENEYGCTLDNDILSCGGTYTDSSGPYTIEEYKVKAFQNGTAVFNGYEDGIYGCMASKFGSLVCD